MTLLVVSGFYPEPNPDNSLHYEKTVPRELESEILRAMTWQTLADVPPGETDLTRQQAAKVLAMLGDLVKNGLVYSIGVFK
jgi:hypothetical protein